METGRHIQIGRDAVGNTLITGDGNVVVIQTTHALEEEQPEPTPIGPNPYKGLSAFDENDADRFFGREALTDKLWDVFRSLHEPAPGAAPPMRLLPILGPSGSGKSSLTRAGLIPELARRPIPGLGEPQVAVFTPGAHPIEALAAILARIATHDATPVAKAREFADELTQPDGNGEYDGLRRIADALPKIATSPLIVLVDQFEEIYSLCEDGAKRDAFIHNMVHAAGDRGGRVSVILTLRSDFLGATGHHHDLNQVIADHGVIVPAMGQDDLRRAIEEPARQANHPIDEATVDLLVSETEGREGALPLLQFVLTRIWEGLAEGTSAADTVRKLGGVGGALAAEAQRLYDTLDDPDKEIARRAFIALVRLGEGTRDTRRRAPLSEIVAEGEAADHVLDVLRVFSRPGERLITLSAEGDTGITSEITHEALFDHWQRLREWLDSSREDIRFQRQLAETVERWDKDNRPAGSLWRPPNLDRLRRFHDESELRLNETQSRFLHASEARQRRVNRIRQMAVAGIGALLLVIAIGSVGFGIYADKLRQEAEASREIAERESTVSKSRAILALAQSNRPNNVECSLLLAVKALQTLEGTKGVELSPYVDVLRQSLANSYVLYTHRASEAQISSASWTSDGRLIAYITLDGVVRAFDPTKPDTEHALPITGASALAWHPSQSLLAVGKSDGHVEMWRLQATKWSQERRMKLDDAPVAPISWSPNAKFLVASSSVLRGAAPQGRTYLVNSQNLNATPIGFNGGFLPHSAWRPDSKVVAVIVRFRSIALVDTATNVQIALLEGHPANVISLSWHPRESWLAAGLDDGSIWIWDVNEKRPVSRLARHSNQVTDLDWSPDGRFLSSASWDGRIILWNAGRWTQFSILSGHTSGIISLDWESRGSRLVSASKDGTVRIWETRHPRSPITLHAADGWMWDAVWSPNGKYVASASDDKTIKVWDRLSDTTTVLKGHRNQVTRLAWRYDSTKLASVSADGSLAVWDHQKATPIFQHRVHSGIIHGLAWSRSQDVIATSSVADRKIRFWNSKTGALMLEIGGAISPAVSFSPRDSVLAIANSGTDKMALFDLDKREVRSTVLKGLNPSASTWGLAWSPNGDRIAAASDDNLVRIWNVETGHMAMVLKGHTSGVKGVTWNSDGTKLATASLDKTVRIWDAESGKVAAVLPGHSIGVRSVSWSNDGRTLASAGEDGTVRLSLALDQDIIDLTSRQIKVGLTPPEQAACLVQINR